MCGLLDNDSDIIDKNIFDMGNIAQFIKFDDGDDKYQYSYASEVLKATKDSSCLEWLRSHSSPVIFVKNSSAKEFERIFDGPDGKQIKYTYLLLGAYFYQVEKKIEIYDNVIKEVSKNDEDYNCLFSMTLLHELMHAILDSRNEDAENKMYTSLYGFWKEESYANAGVLKMIEDSKFKVQDNHWDAFKSNTLNFIKTQPAPYRYGLTVFENEDFKFDGWKKYKQNRCANDKENENLWLKGLSL